MSKIPYCRIRNGFARLKIPSIAAGFENEFVAPQADALAFNFRKLKAAFSVKIKDLVDRCDFVRITADPVDDVVPAVHAPGVFIAGP